MTAGNASGVNDGACAVLLASEAAVKKHGLTPRVRVVATAAVGVAPRIMGFAPAPAVRKVLKLAGLELSQVDLIELNEAFAAQALAVTRDLGLADNAPHVNPNGGAICHRTSPWGERRATGNNCNESADRHEGALRDLHDVHRRWPRHRDCSRALLTLVSFLTKN